MLYLAPFKPPVNPKWSTPLYSPHNFVKRMKQLTGLADYLFLIILDK